MVSGKAARLFKLCKRCLQLNQLLKKIDLTNRSALGNHVDNYYSVSIGKNNKTSMFSVKNTTLSSPLLYRDSGEKTELNYHVQYSRLKQ